MPAKWLALIAVVPLCIVLATPGQAQPRTRIESLHTLSLGIWPTSVTATAPPGNWSTLLWILDYRLSSQQLPWGFHLQYATGSQSGSSFAPTGGTDTIWSADITYRVPAAPLAVRGFAGFGSIQWQTTTLRVTSRGLRVGLDAAFPLPVAAAGAWSVNAAIAWYPSNTVSTLGVATVGSGSATDWSVSIRYKAPSRTATSLTAAADQSPGRTTAGLLSQGGHDWDFEAGFRALRLTGSAYNWSGFFLRIGKTF